MFERRLPPNVIQAATELEVVEGTIRNWLCGSCPPLDGNKFTLNWQSIERVRAARAADQEGRYKDSAGRWLLKEGTALKVLQEARPRLGVMTLRRWKRYCRHLTPS